MINTQIQPNTLKSNTGQGKEANIRIQDLQDKIVKATLKNNMKEVYRLQEEIVNQSISPQKTKTDVID